MDPRLPSFGQIPINWEHRVMLGLAPDYDGLMVIQKVEVFEHALDTTSGEDLHKVGKWGGPAQGGKVGRTCTRWGSGEDLHKVGKWG